MPGSEANSRPESFAQAPLEEATERLVAVVRRTRPQVMAIYPAHQSMYPHPDHIRAHEVGLAAFLAAGDPEAFPAAGPPWQPLKLYYMLWSKKRHDGLGGDVQAAGPGTARGARSGSR